MIHSPSDSRAWFGLQPTASAVTACSGQRLSGGRRLNFSWAASASLTPGMRPGWYFSGQRLAAKWNCRRVGRRPFQPSSLDVIRNSNKRLCGLYEGE